MNFSWTMTAQLRVELELLGWSGRSYLGSETRASQHLHDAAGMGDEDDGDLEREQLASCHLFGCRSCSMMVHLVHLVHLRWGLESCPRFEPPSLHLSRSVICPKERESRYLTAKSSICKTARLQNRNTVE